MRTVAWLAAATVATVLPAPAMAFAPRAGNTVVVSQAVQDDLYAAGGVVTATAPVDGDLVAAGGTVELDGPVTGGVLAAGGMLKIGGPVGRSVRGAAGTLSLSSRVGADAVLLGGAVTLDRTAEIGRDLVVRGGTVTVLGTVGRNARIAGSSVVIGGTIAGGTEILAYRIVLSPTARLGGTLRYAAEQPVEIQPGAQVAGGTERLPASSLARPVVRSPFGPRFWLARHIAEALALLVLGLVVFRVAPLGASAVAREIDQRFWRTLLAGFLLVVAVPAAAVLALFTIVGIPLSAVALLLYLATLYPAQVFVAAWLGTHILRRTRWGQGGLASALWAVVVGTVALALLLAIPYGGWAVRLGAVFLGFGALWVTVWKAV